MELSSKSGIINTAIVHPLVTLNISDHWTRIRVQNGFQQKVVGVILGKHSGRNIEILNSFEVRIDSDSSGKFVSVDNQYYLSREALYKETFPDLEFLGFYVTGDRTNVDEEDVALQREAMQINESTFLLKFNALKPVDADKLALNVFESVIDPTDETHILFQSIPIKIHSELSEQIGLDHVARHSKTSRANESLFRKNISAQSGAISTFIQQLYIARDYVNAVSDGKLKANPEILSEINKFCRKLSNMDVDKNEYLKSTSDQMLLLLLTSITTVQGSMFNLISKLNVISSDRYPPLMHPHSHHYPFGPMFYHQGSGRRNYPYREFQRSHFT